MRIMRWLAAWPLWVKTFFLRGRAEEELDEELAFHLQAKTEELVERGVEPSRAREMALRAMEGVERQKERCREARAVHWLDSLRADLIFGWRQLQKRKVSTATAVLSLGLAVGGCISAFRLIDALFLRPMPIAHPERLYGVFRYGKGFADGKPHVETSYEYPVFEQMRAAVKEEADVIAVSYAYRVDVNLQSEEEIEKAEVQYVSGPLFGVFGLQPVLGRLLSASDDVTPGAHPYAVLSYDYWGTRFNKEPGVIGRTFHVGTQQYEIVGVAPKGFSGTEPGAPVDIFLPTMMHEGVTHPDWGWLRILIALKPGISEQVVQEQLRAVFEQIQKERIQEFSGRPKQFLERFLSWQVRLRHTPAGISDMQKDYRLPLIALSVLLGLVLLIACTNEANRMSVQSAARAGEMAVRFSLGAGRGRLVRMVLVEGAMTSAMASALGVLFSLWALPFLLLHIRSVDLPIRISLEPDWMVALFGVGLTIVVTLMFALLPAIRASEISPLGALKGDAQPQKRKRWMLALIGAQTAFCFVVLFLAGLLVMTFQRLTHLSPGFNPDGLLLVDVAPKHAQEPAVWDQTMDALRSVPGVVDVAQAQWPLLSGNMQNCFIAVNGEASPELNYVLFVSPGWSRTMRIPLLAGRDFRADEVSGDAPLVSAMVNETFAKEYFGTQYPIGKQFRNECTKGMVQVVGVLKDARYQDVREGARPVFYMPFHAMDKKGALIPASGGGTLVVRTEVGDTLAVAETLRKKIKAVNPEMQVLNVRTQQELIDGQTVRERTLAMLAAFLGVVAPLLAGIGLYGVLSYSVLQREREFGLRIAVGAPVRSIVRLVTAEVFVVIAVGVVVGAALASVPARYIANLLFAVSAHDPMMFLLPAAVLMGAAALAAISPIVRAASIDPARMLRAE
jgi:putative ABC transport system permease protein